MKTRNNKAVSNVISEMMILALVVVLASAFVISLQSNVSYYVKSKELCSLYLSTTKNEEWINFTAIHSGGDPTAIIGHIFIEDQNGVLQNLDPYLLTYNETPQLVINGEFNIPSFKFGDQFQLTVKLDELIDGTIHCTVNSRSQILAEVDEKI